MTQGERQNYQWRPNDESVTTRMRYDLEAAHWARAFKSAEMKQKNVSFTESIGFIGLLLDLVFSLVFLIVVLVIGFVKWARS